MDLLIWEQKVKYLKVFAEKGLIHELSLYSSIGHKTGVYMIDTWWLFNFAQKNICSKNRGLLKFLMEVVLVLPHA